jgi:LPXTG-motif cell wall-anchored protein
VQVPEKPRRWRGFHRLALVLALATAAVPAAANVGAPIAGADPTPPLKISEFRVRGPNGANDEFIEIVNVGADHTVDGGGTGYAVAASDGVARCVIPNGAVIPQYGHYLCVNSVGYSLASYPAGEGTTATGDATYTTDIPDNAGIALFESSVGGDFDLAHRLDAVGSTSEANTLYKEGTGYQALTPFSIDYSFYRSLSTNSITSDELDTTTPGVAKDTDDNAADFVFVDTNGTSAGAGQRLGAPGPENLSSPRGNGDVAVSELDSCVAATSPPNAVQDLTSDPANNSTFGTADIRRTLTNNTGAPITRLRLRVADQRTFPAPSGFADMRTRTSTPVVVTVDRAPCGSGTSNVTVYGTTMEQPPSQPNGGAFNTSWSVPTITSGTPLAPGTSIDVRMLLGLQQTGDAGLRIIVEAETAGTVSLPALTCLNPPIGGTLTDWCVDDVPVAVADSFHVAEDGTLNKAAVAGALANDTDADTLAASLTAALVTDVSHGTLTLAADGSFGYVPAANYHGPDSFSYTVSDETSTSTAATVSITVDPLPDAPVADDDAYGTPRDTVLTVAAPGPLDGDVDADGDAHTIDTAHTTAPAHGALSLAADGAFTYTPAAGYVGPDSFTYVATDGANDSAPATVTLTVAAADHAPVAKADAYTATNLASFVQAAPGVLANDTDAEGDALTAALESDATFGHVELAADGSFTYVPFIGFAGNDTFSYRAVANGAKSGVVTVSIEVSFTAPPAMPEGTTQDLSVSDVGNDGSGRSFVVAGSGFLPGEVIHVVLYSDPIDLGDITVGPDGSFSVTMWVPADVPAGSHHVVAYGAQKVASMALELGDADALPRTGSSTPRTLAVIGVLLMGLGGVLLRSRKGFGRLGMPVAR